MTNSIQVISVQTFGEVDFAKVEVLSDVTIEKHSTFHEKMMLASSWPCWVHEMYDPQDLAIKVKESILGMFEDKDGRFLEIMPNDPGSLSHWVARTLPLFNETDRFEDENSTIII